MVNERRKCIQPGLRSAVHLIFLADILLLKTTINQQLLSLAVYTEAKQEDGE
jgi:hypothetical protein